MTRADTYNYGMVGNCTSAALISHDASVDWLCLPFFNSPSLFARLLDHSKGGHFRITGIGTRHISQAYLQDTAILKTTVDTSDGRFEILDYMPRYSHRHDHYYCPSELHRSLRVVHGRPRIRVTLQPRPNYATGGSTYERHNEYIKLLSTNGNYMSYYLYSNLDRERIVQGDVIELPQQAYIVLSYHEKVEPFTVARVYHELEKTKAYWLDYIDRTRFPERYREDVVRSIITLKLLSYQRTGAVLAAPTTSLPEIIGQSRNWDYRYCWMRDGGMTIDVYARLGDFETSAQFMQYIIQRLPFKNDPIQIMYGIEGEKRLQEQILGHLSGYENSRPVRIGNAAYEQQQNDLYGNLIEAIYTFLLFNTDSKHKENVQINEEIWTVVRSLVNHIKGVWSQPDSGIWEFRGAKRHFVHSKVMSWVGMDRAAKIAAFWGRQRYIREWSEEAKKIKEDILTNGWNEALQSFTMYYGSEHFDASNLLMLHYNFLPQDDPRVVKTVRQCYERLVKNGFMFRYVMQDDFGTPQTAFLVCTFWMINALYILGEKQHAREMFEHVLEHSNHLGLLSEGIETDSGRLTGNFPQAYSHLALIQSAFVLETEYNWLDKGASLLRKNLTYLT